MRVKGFKPSEPILWMVLAVIISGGIAREMGFWAGVVAFAVIGYIYYHSLKERSSKEEGEDN